MDEIQTKGIDILLKALKILINGNNEIYLTVVGDGPNKEKYKEYCTKENISKYVNFLDPMPHKELLHKIRNHSVLVISSRIETFSIVGIEAMGLGLPVIATKCGGPEDYITKETGLVVDKENPKLLAESIIFMKKNLKKYNNKKIAAYANKNFSDKVIINKIINIYKNIK